MPMLRCPLALIFALQCALVIGAFIAVLLVLTEQQRVEFRDGLNTRLGLQQRNAIADVYAPIKTRLDTYKAMTYDYIQRSTTTDPAWLPSLNATLQDMGPFYERLAPMAIVDPLTSNIMAITSTTVPVPPGPAVSPGTVFWSAFLISMQSSQVIRLDINTGCVGPAPRNLTTCNQTTWSSLVTVSFAPAFKTLIGRTSQFTTPSIYPTVFGTLAYLIPYFVPFRWTDANRTDPDAALIFTMSLPHLDGAVAASAVAPGVSVVGLFAYVPGQCQLMVSSGVTPAVQTIPGVPVPRLWACGQTPHAILNDFWARANAVCAPVGGIAGYTTATGCSSPLVLEFSSSGGGDFIGSAQRLRTAERLDLLLLQATPRSHFYAASERARLNGILIGSFAALGVVLACVAILFAIWLPVRALQANMDLAALMRNEEVTALKPVLSEVAALTKAFDQMNTKLLLARPFLPPSLLMAELDDGSVDADGVRRPSGYQSEGDEEGALETSHLTVMSSSGGGDNSTTVDHHRRGSKHVRGSGANIRNRRQSSSTSMRNNAAAASGPDDTASRSSRASHSTKAVTARVDLAARGAQLVMRRAAVLIVNLRGFHAAQRTTIPDTLALLQRRFAELVEQATTGPQHRGIVDAFHGDRFVCTFNTARPCAQPAVAAALAAVQLETSFTNSGPSLIKAFPNGLSMGMSCGKAVVGNMGTATMQRLVTVSEAFSEAIGLQEFMARRVQAAVPANCLGGRCLVAGRTASEVEHIAEVQVLAGAPAAQILSGGAVREPWQQQPTSHRQEHQQSSVATANNNLTTAAAASAPPATLAARAAAINAPFTALAQRAAHQHPSANDGRDGDHQHDAMLFVACLVPLFGGGSSGSKKDGAADEWLYELQATEKIRGYTEINAALLQLWQRVGGDTTRVFFAAGGGGAASRSTISSSDAVVISLLREACSGALNGVGSNNANNNDISGVNGGQTNELGGGRVVAHDNGRGASPSAVTPAPTSQTWARFLNHSLCS